MQSNATGDIGARFEEAEKTLQGSERQWLELEDQLEDATDSFLLSKLASWQKWFGLEEPELRSEIEGGVRPFVRLRVHSLLLGPLAEKTLQKVGSNFRGLDEGSGGSRAERRCNNHALQLLLEGWEEKARGVVQEARLEDDKLAKKIRKTEKDERAQGIVALGMQDTKKVAALKKQRPVIWERPLQVLEKFNGPIKGVSEVLREEATEAYLAKLVNAVPVVATRALCDWYFQRCLLGLDELEKWWANAKAMLKSNERLWQVLEEREGLLMRRVDRGIDDVRSRRQTYPVYANFGGTELEVLNLLQKGTTGCVASATGESGIMGESALLLANEVSEIHRRLRMIRDSALWRVVEAAQEIHRQLCREEPASQEPTPWQGMTPEEGARVFVEAIEGKGATLSAITEDMVPVSPCSADFDMLGSPGSAAAPVADEGSLLFDAAVVSMGRLEKLGCTAQDLVAWLDEQQGGKSAEADAARSAFAEVVSACAELSEDILALLDEPVAEAAVEFLRSYEGRMGGEEGRKASQCLEEAMNSLKMPRDSQLGPVARKARRQWLGLMRGMQTFLLDGCRLRSRLVAPLTKVLGMQSQPESAAASPVGKLPMSQSTLTLQEVSDDLMGLSTPQSPRPSSVGSQGLATQLQYRPPERRLTSKQEGRAASNQEAGTDVFSAPTPLRQSDPGASDGGSSARAKGSRPIIPQVSFQPLGGLLPDTGKLSFLAGPGWRPDTPSTACEDDGLARTPNSKFVEGQYIAPRPGSGAGKRLPPLALSPGKPREAW
mmetsp:Transcript_108919/g.234683  ORF Transcript_108919/g.234683 Transcript_108919/m.234683 type:complete len:775 (-) Transcript_108919:219-2543(-)